MSCTAYHHTQSVSVSQEHYSSLIPPAYCWSLDGSMNYAVVGWSMELCLALLPHNHEAPAGH